MMALVYTAWVIFGIIAGLYLSVLMKNTGDSLKMEYFNFCKYHSRGSFILAVGIGVLAGFYLILPIVIFYVMGEYEKWSWFHKPVCKKEE